MNNVNENSNLKIERWIRPWNTAKFDDMYNRDERYFSVVLKGLISWLNTNIVMYDKPIKHFIYSTGSSYMYMETNGYFFSWNETSGEDMMYMEMPRCIIEFSGVNIPAEELTSPFATGTYERKEGNTLKGFNAQIRRLPIELDINLKYVLSNFNESIILCEEIINKMMFQRYYSVAFLGQIIKCSIEFPANFNIELNRIDMTDPTTNQKNLQLSIKINANYPLIDERTEMPNDKVISTFIFGSSFYRWTKNHPLIFRTSIGESIRIHMNDDGKFVDDDDNDLTEKIRNGEIRNENGESLNETEIISSYKDQNLLTGESTLFFEDISNTVDIISREKILK